MSAFVVALLNTMLVTALAAMLATVLGFIIGIARLSSNDLVASAAGLYVEFISQHPAADSAAVLVLRGAAAAARAAREPRPRRPDLSQQPRPVHPRAAARRRGRGGCSRRDGRTCACGSNSRGGTARAHPHRHQSALSMARPGGAVRPAGSGLVHCWPRGVVEHPAPARLQLHRRGRGDAGTVRAHGRAIDLLGGLRRGDRAQRRAGNPARTDRSRPLPRPLALADRTPDRDSARAAHHRPATRRLLRDLAQEHLARLGHRLSGPDARLRWNSAQSDRPAGRSHADHARDLSGLGARDFESYWAANRWLRR